MTLNNNALSFDRLEISSTKTIHEYFSEFRKFDNFVRVGPKGYLNIEQPDMEDKLSAIYNLSIRKSDVFILSFPRSGTTWTQELVWLVANDLDYATAKSKYLIERYNCFDYTPSAVDELSIQQQRQYSDKAKKIIESFNKTWGVDMFASRSDPRFIQTHIPLSLLPPNLLNTAKVVYVARDPRDVAVSFFHFQIPRAGFIGDFKTYWNLFYRNLIIRTPFFDHLKEAWQKRNHPNLLFIFYEDLSQKLPETLKKICAFFGKNYTDEQISTLFEHLQFENFKENPSTNVDFIKELNNECVVEPSDFVRKGKCGGWREYFDDEMKKQAEEWMEENLQDTDLRFPTVTKNQ